jgi:carbonic anhydrase/acetyltransferase-like protein (isoleucine patch superfamily)
MIIKYELEKDDVIEVNGHRLYRIRAARNFKTVFLSVEKGDIGGYIQKGSNLEHDGRAWIFPSAMVYGNAIISYDAVVYDTARVFDNAIVFNSAQVYGNAMVFGVAMVRGESQVYGNALIYGDARIRDFSRVFGNAQVYGDARVNEMVRVFGNSLIHGDAYLEGDGLYVDVDLSGDEPELEFDEYEDTLPE